MSQFKNQILAIQKDNPSLSYQDIANQVGCSRCLVSYYLNPNIRIRNNINTRRYRKSDPIRKKATHFMRKTGGPTKEFAAALCKKFLPNPKCYLTGRDIDINSTRSYELDHIVPQSLGGADTIENAGLTCKDANRAKNDLRLEDFLTLCADVLKHHGYQITKD